MTNDEMDAIYTRLKALHRAVDQLVIDGVSRRNSKAVRAMNTLLHARTVADDLFAALVYESRNTQLAKSAYIDAISGTTPH